MARHKFGQSLSKTTIEITKLCYNLEMGDTEVIRVAPILSR